MGVAVLKRRSADRSVGPERRCTGFFGAAGLADFDLSTSPLRVGVVEDDVRLRTTSHPRRRTALALAVGVALLSAACGDDTSAPATTRAGANTVDIERSRFKPDELTVSAGTTVEFVNHDPFEHTVTAQEDSAVQFDSGRLGQDETFERTFDQPGSYDYFCEIHPTMRATVVVEPG